MKLLMENWRQYLNEDTEIFGYYLYDEDEKVFLSDKIFTKINKVVQDETPSFSGKPKGLWYSCGDDWIQWASSEMPGMIDKANYLYKIEGNYDKIKAVHSEAEFRIFEKEYGVKSMIGGIVIDWKKLQDDGFAGIEICPYFNLKYVHISIIKDIQRNGIIRGTLLPVVFGILRDWLILSY